MPSLKSLSLVVVALLGCCLLFPACSTPPHVSGVSAKLVGFRPMDNPDVPNRAIMTVRFSCEDLNAAAFSGSTHKLYFNGVYVGNAENTTPIGLPAQGSTTMDMTFVIEDPVMVRRSIGVSDQALYRMESELRYSDNGDLIRLKTHDEGKIPLAGLEQAVR